jgi:hypothetical protein
LKKKTSQQAAEVGLSNPLRFFASRLAAALRLSKKSNFGPFHKYGFNKINNLQC